MNIEFEENDGSNPAKPRFVFEDHNDFIKREPVIKEELDIDDISPDIDALKTEQDEPNQSDKNDSNILIETKLNFPIENQTKVIKTLEWKMKIAKHYPISTSENSNKPIVPELIENNLPNETHVEIKSELLEPIAEVDVKEHITFEPFAELDIQENIVKTEEKQPLGLEDVRDNLKIEDTNKISCIYCELRVKDHIQLAIHTHNFHLKSQYSFKSNEIRYVKQNFKACDHCEYQTERKASLVKHIFNRHMPKQNKKTGRKHAKYTCHFCDKKFTTKYELYVHDRTHNGKISSYNCVDRALKSSKWHVKAPGIEPFVCNLCKHRACTSGSLKYHMKKFHDVKSVVYNCDHCQSSFSQKYHLIDHLKLQSDDYKCLYTNNITKEEKELIDNYECNICPFKCTKKLHFKAHISRQKSKLKQKPVPVEKRYSCQFCNFKSMAERAFDQHLKKNHQQLRPYFCKLCDCKYSALKDLVKHIKVTHLARKE